MEDFTGGVVQPFDLSENNVGLFERIVQSLSQHMSLLTCSIQTGNITAQQNGLVTGHAYTVIGAETVHTKHIVSAPRGGGGGRGMGTQGRRVGVARVEHKLFLKSPLFQSFFFNIAPVCYVWCTHPSRGFNNMTCVQMHSDNKGYVFLYHQAIYRMSVCRYSSPPPQLVHLGEPPSGLYGCVQV